MTMTKKEQREMDRLRAIADEAKKQRDRAWDAYTEMLHRVVNAEQALKRIREELDDEHQSE